VARSRYRSYAVWEEGAAANQLVERGEAENPDAGSMSSHLYKERKGGPATMEDFARVLTQAEPTVAIP
jgi:hypothetical protein